ncbi:MAG: type II toxin-antitoxin system RelE/ParE family toxin [Syntrophaceae bacterium]|nr:type II toxin-antitoxin system RelE/ParE family toxin [Syntrophaceae bacterium]
MSYALHILGHAERDIKRIFKVAPATATLIVTDIRKLSMNPHPLGHTVVVGQKNVFRIHTAKRYRVIYSIFDQLGAIIVVTVRLKGKDTYKNIPVHDIATQVEAIEEKLKSASYEVTHKPTPR